MALTSKVTRLHHAGISVRDPHASLAFYRDVIGLAAPVGSAGAQHFHLGGGVLAVSPLRPGEAAPATRPFGDHLAFEVEATVDDVAATLTAHRLEFQRTDGRVYVRDPDGYVIELVAGRG